MKPTPMPTLILMAMVSPIALNAVLPALPLISEDLSVSTGVAQLSLSLYLAALAIGQLSIGGLTSNFGLKRSLQIGLFSFLLGSVFSLMHWGIEMLLLGRILQGFGGAAMISISRALLVESYGSKVAPQKMGYIIMAIALSQSIAPLLGSYISSWFGWGYIFLMSAMMSVALLVLSHANVAANANSAKRSSIKATLQQYRTLLKNNEFRAHAAANTLLACSFYFFVSASPHLARSFDEQSINFGYWFMTITLTFMLGGYLSTYVNRFLEVNRAISLGNAIALLGAILMVGAGISNDPGYAMLFLPMSLVTLGRGISQPSYQSAAIAGGSANAGMAAGLMGFLQLAFGAICSQVSPTLTQGWFLALPILVLLCTFFASAVHYTAQRKQILSTP
jgi:DHA1 family bicyclomycin/chloramphenicol resistance-like MFS transporter